LAGNTGGLRSSGNEIHMCYLDPDHKLAPRRAKSGTPKQGFGSPDNLKWIEKTVPVAPASGATMTSIWDHLHASIRDGKPFPITLDEALGVMQVISAARKGTPFAG